MNAVFENRDEAQMIASILAGNTHEFHNLIQPYERSVYSMALSMLHNEADAEDAAQEAFLKAFRNLAHFRGESKFSTWLVSITLNEARGRLRGKKTMKMESLDEPPEGQGHVSPALLRRPFSSVYTAVYRAPRFPIRSMTYGTSPALRPSAYGGRFC